MDRPHIPDAPGLAWRPRKNGWAAVWLARQDLAKKGFKPSTRQIIVLDQQPTATQENDIRADCVKFQEEMYAFGHEQPKVFGGRLHDLIVSYQTHPKSSYNKKARPDTRRGYDGQLRNLDRRRGHVKLKAMGAEELTDLYDEIRWPDGPSGRENISNAHAAITQLRVMLTFGAAFEIEKAPRDKMSECQRLRTVLSLLTFENAKGREEAITLRQCEDIIAGATFPSIALAQAFQFDGRMRQRDVIGEYIRLSEPGISDITHKGKKWHRGLQWEEISSGMVLEHKMSKSNTGKVIKIDLNSHPMIMAELMKIPPEKRFGPVVICELTGRPWIACTFRLHWRKTATSVGIPKNILNMDSRAGGITETIEATNGNIEAARKQAGHSNIKTTGRYSRRQLESNTDTAAQVLDFRARNKA